MAFSFICFVSSFIYVMKKSPEIMARAALTASQSISLNLLVSIINMIIGEISKILLLNRLYLGWLYKYNPRY